MFLQLIRFRLQPLDPAEQLLFELLLGFINILPLLPANDSQGVPKGTQVLIGLIYGEEVFNLSFGIFSL